MYFWPKDGIAAIEKHDIKSTKLLFDVEGAVGKAYGAKTTPHMFVINKMGKIAYQGAIDDRPDVFAEVDGATNYVVNAVDALINDKEIAKTETDPYGCSVKYAG